MIKRLEEFDILERKETGAFWYQVMGELEELLNDMRHSYEIHEEIIKKYNNADKISYPYRISLKQINLLLSYIEQLENLCNKYEQEHKTTFEIWKKDIKKLEQLENNRDKAIELLDRIYTDFEVMDSYNILSGDKEKLIDILKGDSE